MFLIKRKVYGPTPVSAAKKRTSRARPPEEARTRPSHPWWRRLLARARKLAELVGFVKAMLTIAHWLAQLLEWLAALLPFV